MMNGVQDAVAQGSLTAKMRPERRLEERSQLSSSQIRMFFAKAKTRGPEVGGMPVPLRGSEGAHVPPQGER